ncbi:MAG: hypothetical protein ACI9LY_001149 [Arenicella sp.]|jgi:hypothetical protein
MISLTMTRDSKKDVTNNILTASQNKASQPTKVGSGFKPLGLQGELIDAPVGSNSEQKKLAREVNGPKGLEPTRYGDWEAKGRCCDF